MIIVCSGPDTYRARIKANELVAAFRTKYDPRGLAYDAFDGVGEMATLLSKIGSVSLFVQKKMLRADGCLSKMKIADVRLLATKLEADKDHTIFLTLEEDAPSVKTLEALKDAPLHHYQFPLQSGTAFRSWVREQATMIDVAQPIADHIATYAEGDSWLASTELQKARAGSYDREQSDQSRAPKTIFDAADMVLLKPKGWKSTISSFVGDGLVQTALSQARSFLRIRDRWTDGIHPYVIKKLSTSRVSDAELAMRRLHRALVGTRSGLHDEVESDTQI